MWNFQYGFEKNKGKTTKTTKYAKSHTKLNSKEKIDVKNKIKVLFYVDFVDES